MKNKVFHLISNTHWDREWRFPFQKNRQMLVDMIDEVLKILIAEPKYRAFHLDSQSIVLKDYLEIKPHKEKVIKKLVKENRLLIGPWYILPEEYQVGGENLIRNILLGHKTCKKYGGVSKIGYSPFSWGQISQLPQLYKEFGIELIMFYRGVNSLDSKKAEFIWEGADGTKAITSRFSTMPRYNFYFYIYRPVVHNEGFFNVDYKWQRGGTPFHFADNELESEDYSIINPSDDFFPENIKPQVKQIIKDQVRDFTTDHVIWMEGHDSSGPNIKTVKIIDEIKKQLPDLEVKHSTLEKYAEQLYSQLKNKKLKTVRGERRSAQYDSRSGNLYGYTTSARMYLKQKNYEAEKWLQFYAEPFNSISGILGRDIKNNSLDISWELIIQNSAHDSIGGCSLDDIHDDMMNRYKQSIEISKSVFERSAKKIVNSVSTKTLESKNHKEDIFITVLNPNIIERSEVVDAVIDIPENLDKGNFIINCENYEEIPFEILKREKTQPVVEQMIDRPMYFDMIRYTVKMYLKNIPHFGYKTLKVTPIKKKLVNTANENNNSVILENEYLKVKVNLNGTFNINDKSNGFEIKNVGYFYDEGEAGHAWVNNPLKPFVTTLKSKPSIKIINSSGLCKDVLIKHSLKLPENLTERSKKQPKQKQVLIELLLTLNYNSKRLDLKINLNNTVESHRLRIMFPTFPDAVYSWGEGQFDVVKRPINKINSEGWIEQPMYDYPMHHFVDVSNGKYGLAALVKGLKEYEVLDDKNRTLAITLLRSFEFIIQPSSKQDYSHQKGSQCLGNQLLQLSLYPHSKNWENGDVYNEALNYNNDLRIIQHGSTQGYLPVSNSFISISNKNIVLSCFKETDEKQSNSYILRFYNPTSKTHVSDINFPFNIEKLSEVTLEEKLKYEVQTDSNNKFHIKIESKKIKTYLIKFNKTIRRKKND
jgi:mannosylglycerate hydrolase